MKAFTYSFILLVACSVVLSKDLARRIISAGVPSCGSTCLATAESNKNLMGQCSVSNTACMCNNEPFQLSIRQCVVSQCSDPDKLKMVAYEQKSCPGQQLTGLPACGQICLLRGAANKQLLGNCSGSDTACLCNNDAFQASVRQCVFNTCPFQDALAMLSWSQQTCP